MSVTKTKKPEPTALSLLEELIPQLQQSIELLKQAKVAKDAGHLRKSNQIVIAMLHQFVVPLNYFQGLEEWWNTEYFFRIDPKGKRHVKKTRSARGRRLL